MDPQQPAWGAAMPPGYVPPVAPPKKSGMKVWIIILVIIILLAGGGGGAYALYASTRPKPAITVTSIYQDGATYVGAASTSFTVKGNDFTSGSAITFLLDGRQAPGASTVQSDSTGKVAATTLAVTSAWTAGIHTITAKDASGYITKTGVKVEIVAPGKSNTPGPNGAPTDSANMTIAAAIQVASASGATALTVKNGSVCSDKDDGQPHGTNGNATNGVTYVVTLTLTCSGTYQGGQLTYTETGSNLKVVYSDGLTCTVSQSFVNKHLEGAFSNATTVSGNYSSDAVTMNCNLGVGNLPLATAEQGTWTGVAAVQ